MRMDKWLWAARFFKTRALASKACDLGLVESNGITAKPAREVRIGDTLQIRHESVTFTVEVLQLSEMRGPAAVAQGMYRETDLSRENRARIAEERKAMPVHELWAEGKPSKRDRREIDRFRGRY